MNSEHNPDHSMQLKFSWHDYLIFVLMLCISATIGLYHGCVENKVKSVASYLLGDRSMGVLPVAGSLIASHVSAMAILILPGEIYKFGAGYWLSTITIIIVIFLTVFVYLPVFYNMKVTNIFKYLEQRFDTRICLTISCLSIIPSVIIYAVFVYVPSLALAVGSGISVNIIAPTVSVVCIFYTALGGIKTVVWTDVLQGLIFLVTLVIIAVGGTVSVGGFAKVWKLSSESGRLDIFDFDIDPTKRDTVWSFVIGYTCVYVSIVILCPFYLQRYLLLPTFRQSALSAVLFGSGLLVTTTLSTLIGLVLYAKYSTCDPFASHQIARNDQLVSYFVMDLSKSIPGLNGLFVGGIFAAALSSQSAVLNTWSMVIYENLFKKVYKKNLSEKKALMVLKTFVVILGGVSTLLTLFYTKFQTMWSITISMYSAIFGPIAGVFTSGITIPRTNSKGAFYGFIAGLVATLAVMIPAKYYQMQGVNFYVNKPISTNGCLFNVSSSIEQKNFQSSALSEPYPIFKISFYYHSFIGLASCIITSTIISYFSKPDKEVDATLITPVCRRFLQHQALKNTRYVKVNSNIDLVAT